MGGSCARCHNNGAERVGKPLRARSCAGGPGRASTGSTPGFAATLAERDALRRTAACQRAASRRAVAAAEARHCCSADWRSMFRLWLWAPSPCGVLRAQAWERQRGERAPCRASLSSRMISSASSSWLSRSESLALRPSKVARPRSSTCARPAPRMLAASSCLRRCYGAGQATAGPASKERMRPGFATARGGRKDRRRWGSHRPGQAPDGRFVLWSDSGQRCVPLLQLLTHLGNGRLQLLQQQSRGGRT